MKAVIFDLGDTLVEYEGMPLSWEEHYPAALAHLGTSLGGLLNGAQIEAACVILRRYNTRIHPRTEEVAFSTILTELSRAWGLAAPADEAIGAAGFFQVFRQRLRCFPDTPLALERLRAQGRQIGIFTDVPYGMPRALVLADLAETRLENSVDRLLTSRDAGFRKPSPVGLRSLASSFGCAPHELAYVGNERKDIEAARTFGCEAILIDRARHGQNRGQQRTIASLAEL